VITLSRHTIRPCLRHALDPNDLNADVGMHRGSVPLVQRLTAGRKPRLPNLTSAAILLLHKALMALYCAQVMRLARKHAATEA
jgi:hypothetical protein